MKCISTLRGELLCLLADLFSFHFLVSVLLCGNCACISLRSSEDPVTYSQASPCNMVDVEGVPVLHYQPCLVCCTVLLLAIFVLLICFKSIFAFTLFVVEWHNIYISTQSFLIK